MLRATRRKFMAFIGPAFAGSSLAAKAAADETIAKLAGISLLGSPATFAGDTPTVAEGLGAAKMSYSQMRISASDFVRAWGLPDVVEANFRDNAKYVGCLDPDIACKKSWSMSVKIMTQRQRNYERAVERLHNQAWFERRRAAVSQLLGHDFFW